MRPIKLILIAAMAQMLGIGLAEAARQHPEAAAMCRAECLQTAGSQLGANRARTAQICSIRCNASMDYLAQQNRGGTAAATGRGQAPGAFRSVALPPARPIGRASQDRTASRAASRQAAPPARPVAPPVRTVANAQPPLHGVIYGARTPSAGFGMVVGQPDRMAAHRQAQGSCAAAGPDCRVLAEFSAACGAAAHGVLRSQWALFMTSDPNSYVVTSLSAGSGNTQEAAERDAMSECRARDRQATCRIATSACARRG